MALKAEVYWGEFSQDDSMELSAEARDVDCAPLILGVEE